MTGRASLVRGRAAFAALLLGASILAFGSQPAAEAATPVCPLTDGIVLNGAGTLWDDSFIRADLGSPEATKGPIDVSIPSGTYSITLVSYDDHVSQTTPQPQERWFVKAFSGTELVFVSNAISDLRDDLSMITETVNAAAVISSPITSIVITHDAFKDANPNSIVPLCVSFGAALTQPPEGDPAQIVVLGGTSAISDTVVNRLKACSVGSVTRVAGINRYTTAAAISKAYFAPGVDVAYVATGDDFPDALSGGAAAGAGSGGPVLLVSKDSVPLETALELDRLNPAKIVVLGGTSVVSSTVENKLKAYGPVTRIAGANRFATSAMVSNFAFPSAETVYIATGRVFPDALAGGPAAIQDGGPVLLVEQESIPGPVAAELARLKPSTIVIVGGTSAVSATVETKLGSYAGTVTRISGADRYGTAVQVSKATFPSTGVIFVATGENFPDALAAGPVAGTQGSPVLLTTSGLVPAGTIKEIERLTGASCSS
jgi:putative cell wall-binding protein